MKINSPCEDDIQIIELNANDFDFWSNDILKLLKLSLDNSFSNSREIDVYASKKCSEMKDYLQNDDTVAFLACKEDKIVGWIWCHEIMRLDERMLHIAFFSVFPEYQRRGVGSKLLTKAENYAIESHYSGVDLFVTASNAKALSLYRNNGFEAERYLMKKNFN